MKMLADSDTKEEKNPIKRVHEGGNYVAHEHKGDKDKVV